MTDGIHDPQLDDSLGQQPQRPIRESLRRFPQRLPLLRLDRLDPALRGPGGDFGCDRAESGELGTRPVKLDLRQWRIGERRRPAQDVLPAAFGVPDPKYGEEVCAWIVLKPGEQASEAEIKDFCREQIAHYKVPRYVRFVDEMPLTITGKVQKFVMRQRMVDELQLQETRTA